MRPVIADNALVSVVVPTYNHADFVTTALESVLHQTHAFIEVVIVDDASIDETRERVRDVLATPAWTARFGRRSRLIEFERNSGAHEAINAGIRVSSGEVIAILNSDDFYTTTRIERLLQAMRERNAGLVFSGVAFVDAKGSDISQSHPLALELGKTQKSIPSLPSMGFALLRSNVAITTGNLVFSRSLYTSVGEFRPLRYCHDWDFLLRALVHAEPAYVSDALYAYRIHPTNTFPDLRHLAESVTREVILTYREQVRRGRTPNVLAPSPLNWPYVFEHFIRRYGFAELWSERFRPIC